MSFDTGVILKFQFGTQISRGRFIKLLKKHGYSLNTDLEDMDLLGVVLSTRRKMAIAGNPDNSYPNGEIYIYMKLQTVFELEVLPTEESLVVMMKELYGQPSVA